jgi:hypothetical protein
VNTVYINLTISYHKDLFYLHPHYFSPVEYLVISSISCSKFSSGIIKSDNFAVLWVELNLLSPESKLFWWCVYIPPGNTRYASESCFTQIENDIIHFSQKSKCVALVGDVNERTAKIIIPPDFALQFFSIFTMIRITIR